MIPRWLRADIAAEVKGTTGKTCQIETMDIKVCELTCADENERIWRNDVESEDKLEVTRRNAHYCM